VIHSLLEQEMHFLAADVFADLPKVRNFKARTLSGDVADIPGLQEQAPILPFVTSTNDNCLGRECPDYETCFLVKARRKALDAQVVVINHHLFFADMSVKDTGFGELLPDADVYIFDEAHQLPDIASLSALGMVNAHFSLHNTF
jgi:ATP-dependent DNA helicase DinG